MVGSEGGSAIAALPWVVVSPGGDVEDKAVTEVTGLAGCVWLLLDTSGFILSFVSRE